jgi:hypothetical protein
MQWLLGVYTNRFNHRPEHLHFFHQTFSEWQALGLDGHSRSQAPGFEVVCLSDFSFCG